MQSSSTSMFMLRLIPTQKVAVLCKGLFGIAFKKLLSITEKPAGLFRSKHQIPFHSENAFTSMTWGWWSGSSVPPFPFYILPKLPPLISRYQEQKLQYPRVLSHVFKAFLHSQPVKHLRHHPTSIGWRRGFWGSTVTLLHRWPNNSPLKTSNLFQPSHQTSFKHLLARFLYWQVRFLL